MQFFPRRSLFARNEWTFVYILHEKGSRCPSGVYRISGQVMTVRGNVRLVKAFSRDLSFRAGESVNNYVL